MSDQNDFWRRRKIVSHSAIVTCSGNSFHIRDPKNLKGPTTNHLVKAKFRYAILVADGSEAGRRRVADLSQTC